MIHLLPHLHKKWMHFAVISLKNIQFTTLITFLNFLGVKIVRKYKCSLIWWDIILFYIFSSVDFEIVRLKSWVFSFFQIQIFLSDRLFMKMSYFLMNNKAWIKKKNNLKHDSYLKWIHPFMWELCRNWLCHLSCTQAKYV